MSIIDVDDVASGLIGEIDADPADVLDDERRLDEAENKSKGLLPISKLRSREQFRVLQSQFYADRDASSDWRIQAGRDFGFVAGDQLNQADKAYLDLKERPHVVFNRVLTILKSVAGMEINGRHEIQYIPVDNADTEVNEILSAASKWMGQGCDAEDEESQAFQQCCVTGMGWTESRFSYLRNSRGEYVEEMIDCREMYWDRTACKKNLSDARRFFRVRRMPLSHAMRMFQGKSRDELDAVWAQDGVLGQAVKSIEEKRIRDGDDSEFLWDDRNEVTIVAVQWIEFEPYWLLADEATGQMVELSEEEYGRVRLRFAALGMKVEAAKLQREVFKQAFLGAFDCLKPAHAAPCGNRFSWACITGEYDADKKQWFGLTRVLEDPQRWANKFLSQIMAVMNSTAKGGIISETDAFADQREAEESYAQADEITWATPGALSGQKSKIMPKPGQGDPSGYVALLQFAIESIPACVGVNFELLGQRDINQPGILEYMRKQAGMTVLATLFDSLRRYRKFIGRIRLYYIQTKMSDGRLVRVVGDQYAQAVQLARENTTGEYDVFVADAPTSPNQKESTWALMQPMLGAFKEQLIQQPQLLALVLEYSPLPSKLVSAFKKIVLQQQDDPQAQQEKQALKQLQFRSLAAKAAKDEASAAQSQSMVVLNQAKAAFAQFDAMYQAAMADNMVSDNERAKMEAQLESARLSIEAAEAAARADNTRIEALKIAADADLSSASAERERIGAFIDLIAGQTEAKARDRESAAGAILDIASAHREREGAISDRKKATQPRKSAA